MSGLRRLLLGLAATLAMAPAMAEPTSLASPATAVLAGGCFWCLEADFEKLAGVISVESGYTGGHTANPDYKTVGSGDTGHAESVRVHYDPGVVSYARLLDYFWRHIDPTVADRQFCDIGSQYRAVIFYADEAQHQAAESSKAALLASGRFKQIRTEIVPAAEFFVAEDYHQDYYKKNPLRYAYYRRSCGRDARVAELWGSAY